jgi:hypothetical protein
MRLLRVSLLVSTLLLCARVASADAVSPDPRVILGGGSKSVQITGNTFSFQVDSSGGGSGPNFDFIAPQGGEDIFSLALIFVAPPGTTASDLTNGTFVCGSNKLFPTCGFTLNGDGTFITALFTGASEDEKEKKDDRYERRKRGEANDVYGGIEEGQHFSIDLGQNCPSAGCGWVAGSTVNGVLNPVPEPGTMALLLAGLGFAAVGRKFRRA